MKGLIYKFNPESPATEEMAKNTREYAVMEKLERGEKVSIDELYFFHELWHHDEYRRGFVRIAGWCFDFRPYMKRYLVKDKYNGWQEVRSFSKTTVRKLAATPSHITEIVEIPIKDNRKTA